MREASMQRRAATISCFSQQYSRRTITSLIYVRVLHPCNPQTINPFGSFFVLPAKSPSPPRTIFLRANPVTSIADLSGLSSAPPPYRGLIIQLDGSHS